MENKTSYENLLTIKRKLTNDIDDKMRGIDPSKVVIIAETGSRTYDDGAYSVWIRLALYVGDACNSVGVTFYSNDDSEANTEKGAFFLNQMAAFFSYVNKMSNNSK